MTRPSRTRIKFCGITRRQDAVAAVDLGVDALGFVQVPHSRRYLPAERAGRIRRGLPPFVSAVALFKDADSAFVQDAIDAQKPDLLQFHGGAEPGYGASFGLPYVKALAMGGPRTLPAAARRYRSATALLLDSHAEGGLGGTGKTFAWKGLGPLPKPVLLAGGLDAI